MPQSLRLRALLTGMLQTALAMALSASVVQAHVLVTPTQSKLGIRETYKLIVPTEGASATVGVQLDVPLDVTIVSVSGPVSEYTLAKAGDRITSILWRVNIPSGGGKELAFVAQNPKGPSFGIRWNVHQMFADGSRADWIDPPPAKPAPLTRRLPN